MPISEAKGIAEDFILVSRRQKRDDRCDKFEVLASMKHGYLAVILLALGAVPAQAGNAVSADTVEARTAGIRHVTIPKAYNLVPKGQFFGPPMSLMPPQITWLTPEPEDVKDQTGILSSDSGDYQYESLAPGAEMMTLPEPIPPAHLENHKPVIAIVIDDMGLDRKHSARAVKLPPAVTLSYLPYSPQIKEQTDAAKTDGHELLVHMPMQPDRKTADPGENYLGTDMSPLELHERIARNLTAFTGYVGVNNHMGSKFTRDRDGLNIVMAALKEKKLIFLDSRTSPKTVAEDIARAHHIETSHRDVFIDDDEKPEEVEKSLLRIESIARHAGAAIAIGHPKEVTLSALEKWLPTLKEKGFDLVPVDMVITLRNAPKPAVASASIKAAAKPIPEKAAKKAKRE
ncbi:MAG: divergent polysaccharide deacetylase family protein [Alphaproteobacteria bacterium]|nr:MAG: divergent polysaccharide deacetylase family protein [Alphaproteobacteria bacterium]